MFEWLFKREKQEEKRKEEVVRKEVIRKERNQIHFEYKGYFVEVYQDGNSDFDPWGYKVQGNTPEGGFINHVSRHFWGSKSLAIKYAMSGIDGKIQEMQSGGIPSGNW